MNKNKVWYRQLGYHNNPFSIKPAMYHDNLFGNEDLVAKIIKKVAQGSFIFLEGEYGEGKTTVLKRIIRHFGGRKKVIYFSVNRVENRLQVKKMLNERYGRFGKWFDLRPKDMILLLDEVQDLAKKDVEKLMRFKKQDNFKSIVFVSQEFDEEKFPDVLKKDLCHLKIEKLKLKDAITLVRKRVGDLPLLSDEVIKVIFEKSNKNARIMLKNCEKLCKRAVDYGYDKITNKMLSDVFGEDFVIEEAPEEDKIFLELEEAENELEKQEEKVKKIKKAEKKVKKNKPKVKKSELEEEKAKEEMSDDVAIDDPLEEEKKEFEFIEEVDEEFARAELEDEDLKMENEARKKAVAESLAKDENFSDEDYY